MRRFIFTCFNIIAFFIVDAQSTTDSVSTERVIFEKVESEAAFSGGIPGWRKFLEQKLNPNVPVNNGAPIGKYTVIVQFVVDKDGNIKDVIPLTNHGFGMEQEVMRLIKTGPKWEPATQNGRRVNAYRRQPVTFMVEDDDIEITSKESFVLYAGVENAITISVKKIKPEDLKVTITQGTIVANGNGRFTVKVSKTGKAVVGIYNAKKGNKELGSVNFEVK